MLAGVWFVNVQVCGRKAESERLQGIVGEISPLHSLTPFRDWPTFTPARS